MEKLTWPLNPLMEEKGDRAELRSVRRWKLIVAGVGWEMKSGVTPDEIRVLLGGYVHPAT